MTDADKLAEVVAVQEDIITIEVPETGVQPLVKNEVIYVLPHRQAEGRQERLKAEVLRVEGRRAVAQVFESTRAVGIGDPVE